MIEGATKGMAQSLGDDFTAYLTPEENQSVQEFDAGQLPGRGYVHRGARQPPDGRSAIPNTPAEKAGIQAKDVILAVDGRDVTQMTTDQVAALVRGPAGTQLRITLLRPGQKDPFDVTLTRPRLMCHPSSSCWMAVSRTCR